MLNPFARRADAHALAVGMVGVKMGDRLLQVGCPHGGRLAAVAAKVGLSGRAVVVVPDDASAARARKGAAAAGVLIETETAPPTRLPAEADAFDVAVLDDTAGVLALLPAAERSVVTRELLRVLRPGGRAILIGGAPGGLGAWLHGARAYPPFDAEGGARGALEAGGFRSVRLLAQREGLSFVEGVKGRM
jgi:SAM-dependent methyltransferase